MGQKIQPTMYYLYAAGTIEEDIARMIDSKRETVNAALGEGERTVEENGIMESVLDSILEKLL